MTRVGAASALAAAIGLAGSAARADEPLALPHTIDKVWYRTDTAHGTFGRKHEGDLRITTEALELSAPKTELVIPLAALRMISYGPMGADFDTDWVVIGTERDGTRGRVGLRDGSRLGYGARTPQLFDTLMRVAREHGLAQFAAPAGFVPYTRFDGQLALAVPEGFRPLQHGIVAIREATVTGTVVFSAAVPTGKLEDGGGLSDEARAEVMRRVARAESPAWVLAIREAKRGMRCSGFRDKGLAEVRTWIGEHELLGRDLAGPEPSALAPVHVDRCTGFRETWRGSIDGAVPVVVEVRVLSDDEFVYVLALRTGAEDEQEARATFERGAGTLRLAVARARSKGAL